MKYERLTDKDWHNEKFYAHRDSERRVLKRLWDLENKIEQGTLIELPCKVGADVWVIILQRDNFTDEPYRIVSRVAFKLSMLNDIGKTVFLTREEAEKKLKEL